MLARQQREFKFHRKSAAQSVQSITARDIMALTFYRTWREMREEFNLNGGKQVEASGKATIQPLTMEDCAGIFGLWLVILLSGIVG